MLPVIESSVPLAMMGVARCQLRLGNIRQGIRLANELEDKVLFEDCGDILEQQKQFSEAASIYLKAQNYERAGLIFIKVFDLILIHKIVYKCYAY